MSNILNEGIEKLDLHHFFFNDDLHEKKEDFEKQFSYLNKGKHLRAQLVLGFAKAMEIKNENILIIARAVELIHNATLTHDDVIDKSDFRRGEETLNKTLGNKKAVLYGDYLLARSLTELSVFNNSSIMNEIALCLKRLVDGELFQMDINNPYAISKTDYKKLAILKTGSLFVTCLTCTWHLSNSKNDETYNKLESIGNLLGLIFQIQDDLLDFNPHLEKTPYLDFINNNPNYVLSLVGESMSGNEQTKLLESFSFNDLSVRDKETMDIAKSQTKELLDQLIQDLIQQVQLLKSTNGSDLRFMKVSTFFKEIIQKIFKDNDYE